MAEVWMSLKDAAKVAGMSAGHLRLLARAGRLEATKFGHDWLTTEAALRRYLDDSHLRSQDPYKASRGRQQE